MDLLLIILTVLLKLLNLLNDKKELIWFQGKQSLMSNIFL